MGQKTSGNFARSTKAGLPIYRIDGGPGLVWAASFGPKGRGVVRLAAVDLSRFAAPPVEQQPVAEPSERASEISEAPQPELSIVAETAQPDVTDAATATAEPGEKTKPAPIRDQIGATKDEKANVDTVPVPLPAESRMDAVSSSWEPVSYTLILGLLLAVMSAFTAIYMRRQKVLGSKRQAAQPRTNPLELPAHPVVGHTLPPGAALARIEEIRRSLLDLAASPSLAPSVIPEEPILPRLSEEPRLNQSVERDLDHVLLRVVWQAVQR